MRKLTYGISLFLICGLLIMGFYYSYTNNFSNSDNTPLENVIETENTISPEYHIGIHEGKVIVYLSDGSVYERTDIIWEHLPIELQTKIEEGYIINSPQELYNFLEAYSS